MKNKENKGSARQDLKSLLRLRIKSLQSLKMQFAHNSAFRGNVKTANIAIIESNIASLQKLLETI